MLMDKRSAEGYHEGIFGALGEADAEVFELIRREYERLQNKLQLIAAENLCSRAVLAALGSVIQNKTAEGFPGARFHGGCEVVDKVERLAAARAEEAFGARYVNVQPHSGSQANQIVLTAVLDGGDRILSFGVDQGGHWSHGASCSFSGKYFSVESYYVDKTSYRLDYEAIRDKARQFRPKLIICGASVYSRTIDFEKFREIADEVGAYLLADISHISGLVMAGVHPSPVDRAHFTTTSTYKPGGPRGGVIVMGRDYDSEIKVGGEILPLWRHIERTTFPGVQGTPYLNHIAAKAVFFKETLSQEYRVRQFKIIENAKRLAQALVDLGYEVITGGTDNHMVLVDVSKLRQRLTGVIAQQCLDECGIVTNRNRVPYEKKRPAAASGMRLGTPIVTKNGMGAGQMDTAAELIDAALRQVKIISDTEYEIDKSFASKMRERVKELCSKFPML